MFDTQGYLNDLEKRNVTDVAYSRYSSEHLLSEIKSEEEKISILIVDDLDANLIALKATLKDEYLDIDTANSGLEGLKKIMLKQYALILLDVQMPEMDGFEFAHLIKKNNSIRNVPIMFITALGQDIEYVTKGLELGAIDYISKPVQPNIIKLKVSNHIQNYKAHLELMAAQEKLQVLSLGLQEKTKDIEDSLSYAKLIQKSIFPSIEKLESKFTNSFVLFKPKEDVGGDFYWIDEINYRTISICADCTGHGVPGAMLSMMGFQILEELIRERRIVDPGDILTALHRRILKVFSSNSFLLHQGMDISICVRRNDSEEIEYASAKGRILFQNQKGLERAKVDFVSIGESSQKDFQFKTYYYTLESPTWVYQLSDGYVDQFGGELNKKFMYRKLEGLLGDALIKPSEDIKELLYSEFRQWKGKCPQTDDVTVIGMKY